MTDETPHLLDVAERSGARSGAELEGLDITIVAFDSVTVEGGNRTTQQWSVKLPDGSIERFWSPSRGTRDQVLDWFTRYPGKSLPCRLEKLERGEGIWMWHLVQRTQESYPEATPAPTQPIDEQVPF